MGLVEPVATGPEVVCILPPVPRRRPSSEALVQRGVRTSFARMKDKGSRTCARDTSS